MTGFQGFPPRPNLTGYTAVPNIFFDEVLPKINNMSELKILLAVFRKTYGWVKDIDPNTGQPIYKLEDKISYSQFEKLTGLSSTSIATGLSRAQMDGFLEKVEQGDFSGKTNAWRVVTSGGAQIIIEQPQPPQLTQQPSPNKPHVQYLDVDKADVAVPKHFGTSIADLIGNKQVENTYNQALSAEKKDILGEIFGSTTPMKSEPKKASEKKTTPHQEFIKHWYGNYISKFNVTYGSMTGKEHGHVKALLKDYDLPILIHAMQFYFNHYDKIEGLPADHPKISIFYGWRKTIIPASQHGVVQPQQKSKQRNVREFNPDNFAGEDDFFDN